MNFDPPLIPARLIRRYKRFLADMVLEDGREIVAHCPNPGSMLGLAEPGSRCWLSPKTGPGRNGGRKLDFGWEIVETRSGALVGINTGHANRIVAAALAAGLLPGLPRDGVWRPELKFGPHTRFDFAHAAPDGRITWLEVKSVTLSRQPGLAEFPDARTERGAKHLRELAAAKADGHRAVLLFLVQRDDRHRLKVAADIDPAYEAALKLATAQGAELQAYQCSIATTGISLAKPIAFQP
jgi:sugar fermentation stimulation protein A